MKDLLFIINPKSGVKSFDKLSTELVKELDSHKLLYDISVTSYVGHATEIASEQKIHRRVIVAVGGDGTVNEVGQALIGSECALGIVPTGSGNGLARELGIPCSVSAAIERLVNGKQTVIDTGVINGKVFLNVAGLGFDAKVSHLMAGSRRRGFLAYAFLCCSCFLHFEPFSGQIRADGKEYSLENMFLVSFSNSRQWGNNFFIAPRASLIDGKLNVCLIKRPSWLSALMLPYWLASKKISTYRGYSTFEAERISVDVNAPVECHIDGEAKQRNKQVCVTINPASLKVVS